MTTNSDIKSWFFLIAGLGVCVASVLGGVYVGIWLCFIGGIVDIVNGFNHDPMQAMQMAIGVAKFFFSGIAGWVTFIFGIALGKGLISQA